MILENLVTPLLNKRTYRVLLALLPIQAACVSHQHQPDPARVSKSAECEIVNGSYVVTSEDDGRVLARYLLDTDEVISSIDVEKLVDQVTFSASAVNEQTLPVASFNRFSCTDSVLKVILSDAYSGDGIISDASDRVLELFASDDGTLNLRFIDTTFALFFIIPYYGSSDELVTLQRLDR